MHINNKEHNFIFSSVTFILSNNKLLCIYFFYYFLYKTLFL